jgi:hypothetical protein
MHDMDRGMVVFAWIIVIAHHPQQGRCMLFCFDFETKVLLLWVHTSEGMGWLSRKHDLDLRDLSWKYMHNDDVRQVIF